MDTRPFVLAIAAITGLILGVVVGGVVLLVEQWEPSVTITVVPIIAVVAYRGFRSAAARKVIPEDLVDEGVEQAVKAIAAGIVAGWGSWITSGLLVLFNLLIASAAFCLVMAMKWQRQKIEI